MICTKIIVQKTKMFVQAEIIFRLYRGASRKGELRIILRAWYRQGASENMLIL